MKASGGKIGLLGTQATSSFLLWATAAQACGSTLTTDCVLGKLKQTTEWDGGGLHANTNPGENTPSDCGLLVQLKGTSFVQAAPKSGMECAPKFIANVAGPLVDAAKLDANRISQVAK
jgi:hypothetical protein